MIQNLNKTIFHTCILLTTFWSFSNQACLTKEQLTFIGFTKADEEVTSDKDVCKSFLTGKKVCVDPGDIQSIIEQNLTAMKDALTKQINLVIDNFWNVMGRWNRLYGKILEYNTNKKWSVKHVVMNQNMVNRATFTNLRYNKVETFTS